MLGGKGESQGIWENEGGAGCGAGDLAGDGKLVRKRSMRGCLPKIIRQANLFRWWGRWRHLGEIFFEFVQALFEKGFFVEEQNLALMITGVSVVEVSFAGDFLIRRVSKTDELDFIDMEGFPVFVDIINRMV